MRPFHCIFLFVLCVSQFMPLAFCVMAMPTILISQGVPLEQISLIYLTGIIWVLKFLWAPLIDRVKFGAFGHYKVWLLISQLLLVAACILFTIVGDDQNFQMMMILALVLSVFASTQDIASDAIACRIIPEKKRGLGSAIQLSGGLLATMLGGGVVLIVYEHIGWQACMWVISASVAASALFIIWFDEREIALKDGHEIKQPTFGRLFSFWLQPGMAIWAAALIVLPLSITVVWALASPVLIDRGWTTDKIGIVLHIVAPVLGIVTSVIFGSLLNRYNKWLVISVVPILQLASLLLFFTFLQLPLASTGVVIAALSVYAIDIGLFVILNAFKLEYSDTGTEGTDFTVQNSMHGIAAFSIAGGALYFAESAGFANLTLIACGIAVTSGLFLYGVLLLKRKEGPLAALLPS
ncbi:MAG: MFS transporter [Pseudomonadota bacterium]